MQHGLDPALTFGIALALGITAQAIARAINVPGIILLLLFGVVAGPELLDIVQPRALGEGLHTVVGLAVSVILFEGGMSLNLRRLRHSASPIRKLVTVGAAITAVLGGLLAFYVMGWHWKLSALFGTLVMVTGPTVINPLLRRIRVTSRVHTVLEAEGVLVDAVGALVAVVTLEMMLGPFSGETVVSGVTGLARRWLIGLGVGGAGGALVGLALRRQIVPEGLTNAFTLAFATAIFATANSFASESGIVAVIFAGFIVGNLNVEVHRELIDFKEQLSTLFVGLLFVLLAADVRLQDVVALGWPGVLVVAALMFVVRPISVVASTFKSDLGRREKAFIAWLAPRGIVAAAVSSLFAQSLESAGVEGGVALRSLVFLVIAMTVVIQGASGGLVAKWLRVKRRTNVGVAFLGADALARSLAEHFRAAGEEAVLVDLNPEHCRSAEEAGLKVLFGNALEERTLARAQVDTRNVCIAATANESVNLLIARTLRRLFKVRRTLVLVNRASLGVRVEDVKAAHAEVLFGRPIALDTWTGRAERGELRFAPMTAKAPESLEALGEVPEGILLPFTVRRSAHLEPIGTETRLTPGAEIDFLLATEKQDEALRWLTEHGFEAR